jgi:hypothetical protein
MTERQQNNRLLIFAALAWVLFWIVAASAFAQLPPDRHPIGVYWPDLPKIDAWVKDRGANVIIFPNRTTHGGTWVDLHEKIIPNLRAEGWSVYVIRPPAYILGLPADFDARHRDHLAAYALPDEVEDKQRGEDGAQLLHHKHAPAISAKVLALIKQYRDFRPDVPIYVNLNGEHLGGANTAPDVEAMYKAIIAAVDIVACDSWRGTANRVRNPDGSDRYPITHRWEAWKQLRSWTPVGKPVWGFIDTCNQRIHTEEKVHDAKLGTVRLPSRAPTPGEVRMMALEWFPEGHIYFSIQPNHGKNSVVEPDLEPVLREISDLRNDREKRALRSRIAELEAESAKLRGKIEKAKAELN